jgi:hypothetical protein
MSQSLRDLNCGNCSLQIPPMGCGGWSPSRAIHASTVEEKILSGRTPSGSDHERCYADNGLNWRRGYGAWQSCTAMRARQSVCSTAMGLEVKKEGRWSATTEGNDYSGKRVTRSLRNEQASQVQG